MFGILKKTKHFRIDKNIENASVLTTFLWLLSILMNSTVIRFVCFLVAPRFHCRTFKNVQMFCLHMFVGNDICFTLVHGPYIIRSECNNHLKRHHSAWIGKSKHGCSVQQGEHSMGGGETNKQSTWTATTTTTTSCYNNNSFRNVVPQRCNYFNLFMYTYSIH